MHAFLVRVHMGCSRSSKVVDFGTNRQPVCNFLLVINSNFGHILHVLRYGDLLAENCKFFLPQSHLTPQSRRTIWNFWMNILPSRLQFLRYRSVTIS